MSETALQKSQAESRMTHRGGRAPEIWGYPISFGSVVTDLNHSSWRNYVIFNTSNDLYRLYGFYYLGFLLLGIWESVEKIASLKRRTTSKKVLQCLIAGYISFMGPMGLAHIFLPATRNAAASIMCGFALTLAFILGCKIVPAL